MDKGTVYFINSQGKRAFLSSPQNSNYWELRGRSGFKAPDVDVFSEKMASGSTVYMGKAIKPRDCSLTMVCKGQSTAERDRVFFDMLGILLDTDGTGEGKLYVQRADGATVYLNCVYSGGMNIVDQYQKYAMFTIQFYAADPCFYREATSAISAIADGDEHTFTINNRTAYNMCFRMEASTTYQIRGNITNTTTGKKLTFANASTGLDLTYLKVYLSKYKKQLTRVIPSGSGGYIVPAADVFDWGNSDADFSAAAGENTFTYQYTDTYVHEYVKFYFDEVSLGA